MTPVMNGSKPNPSPTAMVELIDVCLRHQDRILALDHVHCRIERGEFVYIVGQTGSGKSSLLRLLNREQQPTSGEVWVDGVEVSRLHPRRIPALRRKIGVVFQDFRLLPDRTLIENIAFALRVIGVSGKELRQRTLKTLERVGLLAKGQMYPHQVSGGEQQRAAVARAIVNSPSLILADEPTGNLDPDTSLEIMTLLDEINRAGTTILMATHDRHIVDSTNRRVVELHQGRVIRDEAQGRYGALLPPLLGLEPAAAPEMLHLLERD